MAVLAILNDLNLSQWLVIGGCLSWAGWWLWKFTIGPFLNPADPKPMRYFIPWLGSAIPFFNDSYAAVNSGLDENNDIFALTVAGAEFYVVTNPKDVAEVYKNNTTLSFDMVVGELMLACGTSRETVNKMSSSPPPYPKGYSTSGLNPQNKALVRLAIDFHHVQLLTGPESHVEELTEQFLRYINKLMAWDHLYNLPKLAGHRTANSMEVSLLDWCGTVLVEAGTKTYWGNTLWNQSADMLHTFYALDRGMWKMLFQYPRIFSQDVMKPRNAICQTLADYYKRPFEERSDVAWFTKSLETECREAGLNEEEMAATIIILFFVINGNTYKLCFWSLCHVLTNPKLLEAIRAELFSDSNNDGEPTMEHLTRNCPLLDSVTSEVLRLYTSSASMRCIEEDTQIGDHILRKGRRIMIPYRQLHESVDVYGDNATIFQADRFMKQKSLKRSSCFRPFGGGATLCAGRNVAMQEVLAFLGLALYHYDIELLTTRFPRMDSKKPTFGMMAPIEGDEVRVSVTQRKRE